MRIKLLQEFLSRLDNLKKRNNCCLKKKRNETTIYLSSFSKLVAPLNRNHHHEWQDLVVTMGFQALNVNLWAQSSGPICFRAHNNLFSGEGAMTMHAFPISFFREVTVQAFHRVHVLTLEVSPFLFRVVGWMKSEKIKTKIHCNGYALGK